MRKCSPVTLAAGSMAPASHRACLRFGETAGIMLLAFMVSSCVATRIGSWDEAAYLKHNFGPNRTVHVCTYLDNGVSKEQALELMSQWTKEDGPLYGINVVAEGFKRLPRKGFLHHKILDEVAAIPLTGNCDRIFYFVNRDAGDYAYANIPMIAAGIVPPEVLGEVDDPTMTHGFAFARSSNPVAALAFTPTAVTTHEFYHLLGACPHAKTMDKCYKRIQRLKRIRTSGGFYASLDATGEKAFTSREQVNRTLEGWQDSFLP